MVYRIRLTSTIHVTIFQPTVELLKIIQKGNNFMAKDILEIGDSNFESEVLQSVKPVLVDFWAPWCGPCRAIAPIVEELAKDFGDKVKFTKCNVDENPTTPTKYGIKSIPTLIFFKDGEIQDKVIGIVAKSKLEEMISQV
jgi:thioredoxin 1